MVDAAALANHVAHILFVAGLVSVALSVATAMVLEQMGRWD